MRWVIADLPLDKQKELLARYRMADQETQRWVRETIDAHLRRYQPEPGELRNGHRGGSVGGWQQFALLYPTNCCHL